MSVSSPYAEWYAGYAGRVRELYRAERRALVAARPGSAGSRAGKLGRLAATRSRPDYVRRIAVANWEGLARFSERELRAHAAVFAELGEHQALVAGLLGEESQARAAAARIPRPGEAPGWRAAKARLRREGLAQGLSRRDLEAGLRNFERYDPRADAKVLAESVDASTVRLQQNAVRHLAALSGSRLALAVARFNMAAGASDTRPATVAQVAANGARLERLERALWVAFRDDDVFAARLDGLALQQAAAEMLAETVESLGALSRRRAARPRDLALAERAREGADLARSLLRAQAVGAVAVWLAGWNGTGSDWARWVTAATQLRRFAPSYRWPKLVAVGALQSVPDRYDGRLVTVRGFVREIELRHKDGGRKVISRARIEHQGEVLDATVPFLKVDSGGLAVGSWCQLAGVWRASSRDVLGGPALELDRVSFVEGGRSSWSDWVSAATGPVFTPVSHGLATSWTWEPGQDGAGNQLRFGTWRRGDTLKGRRDG